MHEAAGHVLRSMLAVCGHRGMQGERVRWAPPGSGGLVGVRTSGVQVTWTWPRMRGCEGQRLSVRHESWWPLDLIVKSQR